MYVNHQTDSYLFAKVSTTNILDFLETEFTNAGWTIDKSSTEEVFDNGIGLLYRLYHYNLQYTTGSFNGGDSDDKNFGFRRCNASINSSLYALYYSYVASPALDGLSLSADFSWVEGCSAGTVSGSTTVRGYDWEGNYVNMVSASSPTMTCAGTNYAYTYGVGFTKPSNYPIIALSGAGTYVSCTGVRIYITNPADYISCGNRKTELYVHKTTSDGTVVYYSIKWNIDKSRLEFYVNGGFDTNLAVDRQPGTIQSNDNIIYDFWTMRVPDFYHQKEPSYLTFIIDDNHFYFSLYTNHLTDRGKAYRYFYSGVVDKFFNYTDGIYATGSEYRRYNDSTATEETGTNPFYLKYNGSWYGNYTTTSVDALQGYNDLVTPSNYTTAGYNHYTGELYLTQYVVGINETVTDNSEYKPIGAVHNLFKHYGVTPAVATTLSVNSKTYFSFPLDTSNRIALAVE
jgi:hypothetical protein